MYMTVGRWLCREAPREFLLHKWCVKLCTRKYCALGRLAPQESQARRYCLDNVQFDSATVLQHNGADSQFPAGDSPPQGGQYCRYSGQPHRYVHLDKENDYLARCSLRHRGLIQIPLDTNIILS